MKIYAKFVPDKLPVIMVRQPEYYIKTVQTHNKYKSVYVLQQYDIHKKQERRRKKKESCTIYL